MTRSAFLNWAALLVGRQGTTRNYVTERLGAELELGIDAMTGRLMRVHVFSSDPRTKRALMSIPAEPGPHPKISTAFHRPGARARGPNGRLYFGFQWHLDEDEDYAAMKPVVADFREYLLKAVRRSVV